MSERTAKRNPYDWRTPTPTKQKSAQMEGCGQRYGTESAEAEERAKEDRCRGGGAVGTDMMVNLCLMITGEENVQGGKRGDDTKGDQKHKEKTTRKVALHISLQTLLSLQIMNI